jgi:hypothetical protein
MTADMGYEPRTRTMKATDQEDIPEVLMVQARTRENRYINNKVIYKNTLVITTPTKTISGLKSGVRAKGGKQKNKYNKDDNRNSSKVHDQWNRAGTRSSGGYYSNDNQNDNHDSSRNSNGDRAVRNADRGVDSNTKTNDDVTT